MAGESSSSLFEITSEWFLDYCIHLLWKEFRQKRSFSDCWRDTVQDYLVNKKFGISHELANKVHCIRFLIGLVENYQGDNVSSSQESSSEEQLTEDENDVRLLGCDCLKFFDKILQNLMFPFSNAERSHMRSALKLQIVLSHYRHGNITEAKHLFSKLYNENGPDEEYQDDIRELFQSENDSLKDTFLRTHTYDRFLMQVQQFFTPVWKKFETPVLAESTFLENLREESGLKIDAKTLKALFFAWDQSEEAEQNWSAVVEGTHLNIKELKNKKDKRNLKDTDKHSTDKITRQVIKSRGAATNSQQTSLSVNIERCDEVLKKLKASSRRLFSGLKDDYSDMIAGKAGPSGVVNDENASGSDDHDHDTGDTENGNNHFDVKRQYKSALFISSESPNDKKGDTRGKRPLERKAVKRRFNEEHSDAEIVEWESDDETDLQPKMIKLPSPHRKRCLNVKLPTVKHRKFWTAEETKLLEDGVKVYGEGNWTRILNAYNFVGRTSVNLKDRWRTLRKNK